MKAMAKHRRHSIAFKRRIAQAYLAGETVHGLARDHGLSRSLIHFSSTLIVAFDRVHRRL